ncbi:MAG: DUF881 domain-containing protein [Carboxydocellales bacterium]
MSRYWHFYLSLFAVSIVLGLLLSTQAKATMEIRKQVNNSTQRYQSMIAVLNQAKLKQTQLTGRVTKLRQELERNKSGVVVTGRSAEVSKEITQIQMLTGEVPLRGPGLYVTMDDRKTTATQVFSGDIKDIINILRYAGAEAIAVNGQRVVANTSVHEAGRNLLVNKLPINRTQGIPFEISAIGDPENMENMLKVTYGLIADLEGAGVIIKISKVDLVEIPAYKGGLVFKYGRKAS